MRVIQGGRQVGSDQFLWEVTVEGALVSGGMVGGKTGPPTRKVRRSRRKTPLSEALPPAILAQVTAVGQTLVAVAATQRDGTLATLETATLEAIRAAMPGLLDAVLHLSTSSLQPGGVGRTLPCPLCGERAPVDGWRPRTISTVCGALTVERPWYHCRRCQHGWSPSDTTWEVAPRTRLSAGVAEWLIDLGASTSFADAKRTLEKLTGLRVSAETIRQQTEQRGTALETVEQAAAQTVQRTQEAAAPLDPAPGTLVIETDGVMVRYQSGWHEVKSGLVGGQVDGRLQALSYVAVRQTAEEFGPRLLAEAARRGALEIVGWDGPIDGYPLAQLRPVVVVGDGAPWIWNLAADHFGERTEIVDFYHATQHVWTLAHALFGQGTWLAARWADFAILALAEEGAAAFLTLLAATTAPTPAAATVLQRERHYFRTNQARMDYPTFRDQRLPLGSGAVESAGRHLVQLRMKRAGARWSDEGGQAVLNVRCRLISNRSLAA
jgi:Uncharacterised protein family (UPF0236)